MNENELKGFLASIVIEMSSRHLLPAVSMQDYLHALDEIFE